MNWSKHFKSLLFGFEKKPYNGVWQIVKSKLPILTNITKSNREKLKGKYKYYIYSRNASNGNNDINFSLVYKDTYPTSEELEKDIINAKEKLNIQTLQGISYS